MKNNFRLVIVLLFCIVATISLFGCGKKEVTPVEPISNGADGKVINEKINGNPIMSDYEIISGGENFKIDNHTLYYSPSDNIEEKSYCMVIPTTINGMKVDYVSGISAPDGIEIAELYVPDGIRVCTVSSCPKLKKLVFSDTVEEISLNTIGQESEELLDIIWPDNENLSINMLVNVNNIEELYFPKKLKEDDEFGFCQYGFMGCDNLKTIVFPQNLKKLGHFCVEFMNSLEQVEVPLGVTSIGGESFSHCEKLSEIILPEGLLEIGDNCFMNLPSNDYIDIPDSVETIGENTFIDIIYDENDEPIHVSTGVTLGVGQGTYAEQYAKKNGFSYTYH